MHGICHVLSSAALPLARRLREAMAAAPWRGPSGETLSEFIKPWRLNGQFRPYKPVGCLDCRMTGFKGRVGLYELLPVSDAVRDTLHPQVDMAQLRKTAAKEGLRPLRLSGIIKVTEGITTVDEVLRNTPQWDR